MDSTSTLERDETTGALIERDCTITLQGQAFTSGGAVLAPCTDGRWRGTVYVSRTEQGGRCVKTWGGAFIAYLRAHTEYQGNFCKMARVSFDWNGRRFVGDYCPDWSEAVSVRATRKDS